MTRRTSRPAPPPSTPLPPPQPLDEPAFDAEARQAESYDAGGLRAGAAGCALVGAALVLAIALGYASCAHASPTTSGSGTFKCAWSASALSCTAVAMAPPTTSGSGTFKCAWSASALSCTAVTTASPPASPPPSPVTPPPAPPPPAPPALTHGGVQDGSAGAPAGIAPAFPTLFASYKVRPPWPVADVDYAAGNPGHGKGVDWTGAGVLPPCASVMSTYNVATGAVNMIRINGTNCALVGFNFCTGGGVGFYGGDVGLVDLEQDDFCAGPQGPAGGNDIINIQGASGVTLKDIDFNGEGVRGTGSATNAGLLLFNGTEALTVEYVRSYNIGSHVLDLGVTPAGNAEWTIAYNSDLDTGMAAGTHGEVDYVCGGAASNIHLIANLGLEQAGTPTLSNVAPFALVGDTVGCGAAASIAASEVGWNVAIVQGQPGETEGSAVASNDTAAAAFFVTGNISGVSLHDNYLDWSGAYFPFYPVPAGNTVTNNIDLTTGRVCSQVTPAATGDPYWQC